MAGECIPPLSDPLGTGVPQCPDGYTYNPVLGLCCPNTVPPVNVGDPVIRQTITGFADQEFDPAQAYKVGMQGVKDSGIIERFVVALLRGGIKLIAPLIEEAASLLDDVLAILAEVFQAAQGQHSTGYYILAGQLVTDLMGVETDGAQLSKTFQSQGRQAAMVEIGGKIFDVLAAEFANIAQTGATGAFTVAPGTGIGGLPDIPLSPAQGVAGAKAFLGYASAFSIREGNTDMLAAYLPYGIGEMFKDFAEDFSKNLGIGRIGRLVWKPLVNTMVGVPMQQALNMQYRPKKLDVGEAIRANITGDFDSPALVAELAMAGIDDKRQAALFWQHAKPVDFNDLRTLRATGYFQDSDLYAWAQRLGHINAVTDLMMRAEDLRPMREECLSAARHFAQQYLQGRITRVQYEGAVNSVRNTVGGTPILTDGEVANLLQIPELASAAPRRHLDLNRLTRDYEDGLLTLNEFSAAVTAMGYSADDVQLLEQELLISAKRAAERAAKAASAAQRGKLAKLSVAQMKTGFETGLLDLPEIQQELTIRGFTPESITTLSNEFLIAAKLRQPGTPTA